MTIYTPQLGAGKNRAKINQKRPGKFTSSPRPAQASPVFMQKKFGIEHDLLGHTPSHLPGDSNQPSAPDTREIFDKFNGIYCTMYWCTIYWDTHLPTFQETAISSPLRILEKFSINSAIDSVEPVRKLCFRDIFDFRKYLPVASPEVAIFG
jgi:hypothetical protein